ncbi:hypothetical protein AB7W86_07540 [Providencia rettgeri]
MANPISYILFGLFMWWLFRFCENHPRFEGGLRVFLKYLYCFLWPLAFFGAAFVYYTKHSEGMVLLCIALGIGTSIIAFIIASKDPHKTISAIKSFFSRFL